MTNSGDLITEWERVLPSLQELTPLSQSLIPLELASAFNITAEPSPTPVELESACFSLPHISRIAVSFSKSATSSAENEPGASAAFVHTGDRGDRAGITGRGSHAVPTSLQSGGGDQNGFPYSNAFQSHEISKAGFSSLAGQLGSHVRCDNDGNRTASIFSNGLPCSSSSYERRTDCSSDPIPTGADIHSGDGRILNKKCDEEHKKDGTGGRLFSKKDDGEHEEDDLGPTLEKEEQAARTLKRPRLVWTPQLHKRFVDAVTHLGIKTAVPKTIMKLMNVEGLTRENVASHLQKYRLYLKRVQQSLSTDGTFISGQLFASPPVRPSLAVSANSLAGQREDDLRMPFAAPMAISGVCHTHNPGLMDVVGPFHGFKSRAYNTLVEMPPPQLVPGDQRDFVGDTQSQPGSPPRQILTLFPIKH